MKVACRNSKHWKLSKKQNLIFTIEKLIKKFKNFEHSTMIVPPFRKVYSTRYQERKKQKISLLFDKLFAALNADNLAGKEEADKITLKLLKEIEKLPSQ
jgi:hypothetical protein